MLAASVVVPASARGQVEGSTAIDVEQFRPGLGSSDVLGVAGASVFAHGLWQVGLFLHYADDPLVVQRDSERVARLVDSRFAGALGFAIGIRGRFELGAVLPLNMYQGSDDIAGTQPLPDQASVGLGDMRLIPKVRILPADGALRLSASMAVSVPSGNDGAFMGGDGLSVEPRVIGEVETSSGARLLVNAGARFRSERRFANLTIGSELVYGVGARVPFGQGYAGLVTLTGAVGLAETDREEAPLELLGAVEYTGFDDFVVTAGAGPGLVAGYGTPDVRIVAGVTYRPSRAPAGCALGPEDFDGFEDDDDCRDPDNDGDGIGDEQDVCPLEAETRNGVRDEDGCPEVDAALADTGEGESSLPPLEPPEDRDGDGILDADDACADEPEDVDAFEDADGCPDPDNDRDGVLDADDACPLEAEVINGNADDDGCPDEGRSAVQVTDSAIIILDKVYFDTAKASIKPVSFAILNQVAATLKANPQIARIRVEGHTDDRGNDAYNLDLSQRRAEAVRDYLIGKGIAGERLDARGFGETQPIESNRTGAGRANNRRVEFNIVAPATDVKESE